MLKSFAKEIQAKYVKKDDVRNQKITSSKDLVDFVRKVYPVQIDYREAFMCVYLNRSNNTVGFSVISIGGISGTLVDPKVVFQHALLCNASSIIMVHNHPSGILKASDADKKVTKKIQQGGKILDIDILDHIIVTETEYYSFNDEDIL